MEHEHYMEVKFLFSMWEGDMKNEGYEMSSRVRWAFRNLFKKMNSAQRWDTIDGNHCITKLLIEEELIDEQFNPLFETMEEVEKRKIQTQKEKKRKFLFFRSN